LKAVALLLIRKVAKPYQCRVSRAARRLPPHPKQAGGDIGGRAGLWTLDKVFELFPRLEERAQFRGSSAWARSSAHLSSTEDRWLRQEFDSLLPRGLAKPLIVQSGAREWWLGQIIAFGA
jgi:hypothetical protein